MLSLPLVGARLERFKSARDSGKLLKIALACHGADFKTLPPMVRGTLIRESEATSVEQAVAVFKTASDAIDARTDSVELQAKVLLMFYEERAVRF